MRECLLSVTLSVTTESVLLRNLGGMDTDPYSGHARRPWGPRRRARAGCTEAHPFLYPSIRASLGRILQAAWSRGLPRRCRDRTTIRGRGRRRRFRLAESQGARPSKQAVVRLTHEVRDARNGTIVLALRLVELDANPDPFRAELGRADEPDLPLPTVLELDDLSYGEVRHRERRDVENVNGCVPSELNVSFW